MRCRHAGRSPRAARSCRRNRREVERARGVIVGKTRSVSAVLPLVRAHRSLPRAALGRSRAAGALEDEHPELGLLRVDIEVVKSATTSRSSTATQPTHQRRSSPSRIVRARAFTSNGHSVAIHRLRGRSRRAARRRRRRRARLWGGRPAGPRHCGSMPAWRIGRSHAPDRPHGGRQAVPCVAHTPVGVEQESAGMPITSFRRAACTSAADGVELLIG